MITNRKLNARQTRRQQLKDFGTEGTFHEAVSDILDEGVPGLIIVFRPNATDENGLLAIGGDLTCLDLLKLTFTLVSQMGDPNVSTCICDGDECKNAIEVES